MSKLNSNFVANAFARITFKMHTKLVHVSQKMKRDCVCIFICAHVYATPKLENWNNSKKKVLEEIIMAIDNYWDSRKHEASMSYRLGRDWKSAQHSPVQFTGCWWFRKKDRSILGQLESVDDWILVGRLWKTWKLSNGKSDWKILGGLN